MALTLIGIKIVITEKNFLINEYRKLVNKNNNFIWHQGNHSGEKLLPMFTMWKKFKSCYTPTMH